MTTIFRLCKLSVMLVFIGFFVGCATVSFNEPKNHSIAMQDVGDTALGQIVAKKTEQHNGLSGFYPLSQGMDALGVRLRLAERAQKSIDLQYFLMKDDTAGAVIANALLKAGDRGVRVRFLLDDVFSTFPDSSFLLINQHPNIDIRIFNPLSRSGVSVLNYAGNFKQANRRMHNKSFTVDNSVSVVGGRNIADEYFQLKTDSVFVDFDIIAMGPIAAEISKSFDDYWNHKLAVPIEQFIEDKAKEDLETVRANIKEEVDGIYDSVYKQALDSQLLKDIIADRKAYFIGPAWVLSDDPDKLIHEIDREHMKLAQDLGKVIRNAKKEVIFISPYYVPGDSGVQSLRDLIGKGVRVVIITNSLASTNHIPVHSAYARYRKDVIQVGAELNEARANAAHEVNDTKEGPDVLTLHTKAILIDNRYAFIGSLNLDPRSIEINAEMGLLIDSESMVQSFTSTTPERLSNFTYRVILNDEGKLEWHGRIDGQDVIETKEPLTGWGRRFKAWFMKIAPESQL